MYIVRAFKKENEFINKYFIKQKNLIVAKSNQYITIRWISLMTDLFSIFTLAAAGYLGVISVVAGVGPSAANFIGLALVWSLQISGIMTFTLRVMADTESNMNAVVRLY
jgi:ABC-type multidrug transport system fused ATPase/permease subunit